ESGQLKFIKHPLEGEKEWSAYPPGTLMADFSDTIKVRFVNGHTESMMLPEIKYKDKTVVFMADLLPSAGHIPIPYVMAYDMFPLTSMNEKKSFLKEAVENDYILF